MNSGPLSKLAESYFAQREGLGYRPRNERRLVLAFARQMDTLRKRKITLEVVVGWACSSKAASSYVAHRYEVARRFLTRVAPLNAGRQPELPPGYLGNAYLRRRPHIYSGREVRDLLRATGRIEPAKGLRPWTYYTLFGLLLSTGLRIGEALGLDLADVDWNDGTVVVKRSKTGTPRTLPLHRSVLASLDEYRARRAFRHPAPRSSGLFLTERLGTRLKYETVGMMFRRLRDELGWTREPTPSIHDMRHTFAVRTIVRWIRAGRDIDAEMPSLSSYLGHKLPTGTYWYLTAVPELLNQIARRLKSVPLT